MNPRCSRRKPGLQALPLRRQAAALAVLLALERQPHEKACAGRRGTAATWTGRKPRLTSSRTKVGLRSLVCFGDLGARLAPTAPHYHLAHAGLFATPRSADAPELAACPRADGAFLLRNSKTHDGYTLSVKFLECRHIKLMFVDGKYGFSEPTEYDSVQALVAHFQKVSLQCYNAELETTLKFPYKSAPRETEASRAAAGEVDEDLYMSNKDELIKTLKKKNGLYQGTRNVAWDTTGYSKAVKDLKTESNCMEKVLAMLKDQKKLLEAAMGNLQGDADRSAANANVGIIRTKIINSQRNLEKINEKLSATRQKEDSTGRRDTQHSSKHDMKGAGGAASSKIAAVPDPASSAFYTGLIPRLDAESQLRSRPEGTFLIRKSTRAQDPYTLSLRYQGKIKHIQIKYDGARFGLAEPLAFYTLQVGSLVLASHRIPARSGGERPARLPDRHLVCRFAHPRSPC